VKVRVMGWVGERAGTNRVRSHLHFLERQGSQAMGFRLGCMVIW
jgi:hypothetical protein